MLTSLIGDNKKILFSRQLKVLKKQSFFENKVYSLEILSRKLEKSFQHLSSISTYRVVVGIKTGQ